MKRVHAGGIRRANGLGSIRVKRLVSGEARYEARWHLRYLGAFESRAQAQRAIDAAIQAEQADEVTP